jgi:hypothetical protein
VHARLGLVGLVDEDRRALVALQVVHGVLFSQVVKMMSLSVPTA